MQVSVVDYGSGNLQSVKQALISASSAAGINADINVTDQPDAVSYTHLTLPTILLV